jgi:hypothetical protein
MWLGTLPAAAQFAYFPALYNGPEALCRLGINGGLSNYPILPLRLGWYVDYTATAPPPHGMSYFPVIRLEQTGTGYSYSMKPGRRETTEQELRNAVASMPGEYWMIGNEPDRIRFQDDVEPHIYARAYHDLYTIIKEVDPTAKVVAGTIVQPTPLRLQYLDMVLDSYSATYQESMPVDAWSFHNFILNEINCTYYQDKLTPKELEAVCWGADIPPGVDATDGLRIDVQDNDNIELFKEQVIRFRQWMNDRGYRNTPAFLTEFGVLMPQGPFTPDFTVERVNAFMDASFDFLLTATDPNIGYPSDNNRLVQRFAWYSTDDNVNHNGHLFDRNLPFAYSRNAMGDNFAAYAASMSDSSDYYLEKVSVVGAPVSNSGTTTVTLEAVVSNSGHLERNTPAIVRFYNGDPFNGGVQIGEDRKVSIAGCGEKATLRVEWGNTQPGNYTVYARVQVLPDDINAGNNQSSVPVTITGGALSVSKVARDRMSVE